jgi:hypothetical protein
MPMAFDEIDLARKEAAQATLSDKRGRKRKNATINRLKQQLHQQQQQAAGADDVAEDVDALRTGRWTTEETDYCDHLIQLFERGKLPIPDGCKLNDFLSNMLKSKQSRLTKKKKNAKLSTRQYKHTTGYVDNDEEARSFSRLETEFFASIKCNMERSEIRFHMQKEWRELFSNYCVAVGQNLDANDWLSSVEELDRRSSLQKDAARQARRKIMMGQALTHDTPNSSARGVFIDTTPAVSTTTAFPTSSSLMDDSSNMHYSIKPASEANEENNNNAKRRPSYELGRNPRSPLKFSSSPFVTKVIEYVQRYNIPFEHVDAWVPSFVSSVEGEQAATEQQEDQKCRLCFAGCATAEVKIPPTGGHPIPLTAEEQFDLLSFGEYSQKFSFEVGCGLPGRVYSSGSASWEQGIQNAPQTQFERAGGASQWGIQTVLGIPVPSPNVGRVVILFYSKHDRERNLNIVNRIAEELTRVREKERSET